MTNGGFTVRNAFSWRVQPVALLAAVVLSAGCARGTDVGNALTADVQVVSDPGSPPSSATEAYSKDQILEILPEDGGGTLSVARVNIRHLAMPPQSTCSADLPAANAWERSAQDFFFDWLSGAAVPLQISVPNGFTTCQLRFILGPAASGEMKGRSIDISGTTPGGRAFTIRSSELDLVALTSTVPIEISTSAGSLIQGVFFKAGFVTHLNFDAAAGSGLIEITPTLTPDLFAAFMRRLRLAFHAYRYHVDLEGNVERDAHLAQGDDTQDTLAAGED